LPTVGDIKAVALRFNDMINTRDIDGLADLMSPDHRFVDTAGHVVSGRPSCLAAWRGFFGLYPTYRNVFESVRAADGLVTVTGRSICAEHPDLEGPALWTATVDGGLVTEWRVHDDDPESRRRLGLTQGRR